jgi:hypothetical protein
MIPVDTSLDPPARHIRLGSTMHMALTGSWMETVTLDGAAAGNTFQTLFTYDSAGGLTGAGSVDLTPDSLTGPSHGAWIRTGERAYQWTAHAFSFDKQGQPAGLYTIQERIVLDEDGARYTAAGSYEVVVQGNVSSAGRFTVEARRIIAVAGPS